MVNWVALILWALMILVPAHADAHRSGCHRWHSCPSDNKTYVCGDLGKCSQCPDNHFCENGKSRDNKLEPKSTKKKETQAPDIEPQHLREETPRGNLSPSKTGGKRKI